MSAAGFNLAIEAGATFTKTIGWQDPSGAAINLTGYSARLQIRATAASTVVITEINSTGLGGLTLGGVTGIITMLITATATAAYAVGTLGVYDLLLTAADGTVTRLLAGSAVVSPGVTR